MTRRNGGVLLLRRHLEEILLILVLALPAGTKDAWGKAQARNLGKQKFPGVANQLMLGTLLPIC